jgi:PAS domain S-box-containing protein
LADTDTVLAENIPALKAVSDPLRYATLRRRTVVLGSLVIAAFAALGAFGIWRSHVHAITVTRRELGNVAAALAGQTAWSWQNIDLLLRNTASWYQLDAPRIPPEQLDGALRARTGGVRGVRRIAIIDADGIKRYSSEPFPPGLDVSDRDYFTLQRDRAVDGLYLSPPLLSRTDNRVAIVLSRRLEDTSGAFAGVITAIVDLDELKQFYTGIDLGPGSAVQLLRADGTLLVRSPALPGVIGQRFAAVIAAASAGTDAAITRMADPIGNQREFIAAAHVREAPLVIAVTREEAVALEAWRGEALRLAVGTLGVLLLGGFGIAALVGQLRRVEAGERALRQSEERYALALEGANEGHWDWEIGPDRLYLSPRMRSLHGLPADVAVDSRAEWRERVAIHPEDAPRVDTAVAAHFAGETPQYEIEYRVRHPDGNWHWLHVRGRCLRNEGGEPTRFVGSGIDITENKEAQAQREHLELQLRQSQKMEAIGTLAGGIAHDFNNILGAILGYGELAQQRAPQGSPLRRYLDSVMQAAERARALVDRILSFSRSGAAERVPVHVQQVVEETLDLLRPSLPINVRLEAELEAACLAVTGDGTRMHQVVMNLCTNAVQAMQEAGGTLRVELDRVDLPMRRTFSRGELAAGPYLRLAVSDSGCGIPPEALDRIFEPFFTTKRVGEGTGLGLSLVHGIVADLGGVIELDTAVGHGTTVSIWLPVCGAVERATAEAPRQVPHGDGEAVLVVDDEAPLVAVTEEMLAELEYNPIGVVSSLEALQIFRADPRRFDVVVTDEMMPELTGTQLAREIGALRPGIPVILMSGHGGDDLGQRAAVAGVREILRKPLQKKALADALARVFHAPVNTPSRRAG